MKAAPTVTLESGSKLPRAYCVTRQDLPTPESPAGGGQVVSCKCSSTGRDSGTGCHSFSNSPSRTSLHLGFFWAGSFSPLTCGACGFDSAEGNPPCCSDLTPTRQPFVCALTRSGSCATHMKALQAEVEKAGLRGSTSTYFQPGYHRCCDKMSEQRFIETSSLETMPRARQCKMQDPSTKGAVGKDVNRFAFAVCIVAGGHVSSPHRTGCAVGNAQACETCLRACCLSWSRETTFRAASEVASRSIGGATPASSASFHLQISIIQCEDAVICTGCNSYITAASPADVLPD